MRRSVFELPLSQLQVDAAEAQHPAFGARGTGVGLRNWRPLQHTPRQGCSGEARVEVVFVRFGLREVLERHPERVGPVGFPKRGDRLASISPFGFRDA